MAEKPEEDTTLLSRSTIHGPRSGEAARAHYLLVVEGEGKGQRIAVGANPLVIGRSAPADVVLADQRVSRSHCRVCLAFDELVVVDLESSNGTFIDGQRLTGGASLPVGSRLQLGSHVLEHEWRIRKEVEESQELDRDLEKASQYIQALLPTRLFEGPIRSDWVLVPCARLGGDAFGYRFIGEGHFAIYLIDVSGHGTGAAMHAVSVINVLRQGGLPDTNFFDPASVLRALNAMFRMETHGDLFLTIWYGVYDIEARTLTFASAGHHPAYLVEPSRERAIPLQTKSPAIGVADAVAYKWATTAVAPGSMLYVFSDGVFEITTKEGQTWDLEGFVERMRAPPSPGTGEAQRLLEQVRGLAREPSLDDDFTLVALTFLERPASAGAPDATWPSRG